MDGNKTLDEKTFEKIKTMNDIFENVIINKTISMVGENASTTIIDGSNSGTVVAITADNVSITGFTVRNSGWGWTRNGIYVHQADNCRLERNLLITNKGLKKAFVTLKPEFKASDLAIKLGIL
jgi:nitrous oxidase accessory protein NosD